MADQRFFKKTPGKTLKDLAALCGGRLDDKADPTLMIDDIGPLDKAGAGTLSFLDNPLYRNAFLKTKAAACVVAPKLANMAPASCHLIFSDNPYKSFALIAQAFYPADRPAPRIADSAIIGKDAVIGDGCVIEDNVVIGEGAVIGAGSWIEPNAVIGRNVVLGDDCRIGSNSTVTHAVLGQHVHLYPGVRVGQDGFGFAIDPAGHVKVPQLGRVMIGNNVEIGANTCIDRGAGPDTVIGDGTWIDNLVQIAHNVKIGRGCVLAGQVGISGSTVLEDYVVIGGQAGIAGHLKIGKGARIGAQAGVLRDILPGEEQFGHPAQPIKQALRQIATLKRLTKSQKSE